MKTFFSWLGMAVLLYAIGTLLSLVIGLGAAVLGFELSSYVLGFIVLMVLTFGLIWYGTRRKK